VPAIICLKPAFAAGAGLLVSALIGMLGPRAMPLAVFAATSVMALVVCAMLVLFPGLREGLRAVVFRSESSATV
jgi:hypothetical protein